MSLSGPTPTYFQPAPDGRQSVTAAAVQRGLCRLLREHGFAVLTEFTLATGRRADVVAVKPDGRSGSSKSSHRPKIFTWTRNGRNTATYCDQLFFAAPPTLDHAILPEDAGLIVADQYGAEILRQAPSHPLVAARRKAVTLSFARTAAQRLHGLWDP